MFYDVYHGILCRVMCQTAPSDSKLYKIEILSIMPRPKLFPNSSAISNRDFDQVI